MTTRFLTSSFLLCFVCVGGCGPTQQGDPGATVGQADVESAASADPHDIPLTDEEINQLRDETVMWAAAQPRPRRVRMSAGRFLKGVAPLRGCRDYAGDQRRVLRLQAVVACHGYSRWRTGSGARGTGCRGSYVE